MVYAAKAGVRTAVKDADGSILEGLAKTATFDSDPFNLEGLQRIGLFVDLDTVTGTSPTLDIDLEFSPDKGTTWVDLPQSANSETVADLAQLTAAGQAFKWFEVCADPEFCRIRAEFTIGGTSPSFTFGPTYWIGVDHGRT